MKEFKSQETLQHFLEHNTHISNIAVQSVDLTRIEALMLRWEFKGCLFLGCTLSDALWHHLYAENFIFPHLDVPYNCYPEQLYDRQSLYADFDHRNPSKDQMYPDKRIYEHYVKTGTQNVSIKEALARRLHDHSITDAMEDFLAGYEEKKVVAIMGGHNMLRGTAMYRQVASIARTLSREGYLMCSGGGPGAMEATHVGVWFAERSDAEFSEALEILREAPKYSDALWLHKSFEVMERFPMPSDKYKSLGIPTWLYGHEPPAPFATHIAKYFENSLREEGLLAVAKGGVIFSPGSAGTMQEIFQEIAQNHYETFGFASPMIFLDRQYWSYERPVYPIIELMHLRQNLSNLNLGLYDTETEVVAHIRRS